ncbi:hypothetical protein OROHE_021576 [Orobanche hederae]
MESFRKAYGALKDSTKVGLAKVNSEFKDLDIAIVKATNHVERPPKERHVRKIFAAVAISRPRADVGYCIHALSKRLAKTRSWIVAIKTLIVFHRILREGDPSFREELMHIARRGHIFEISNFKDDSSSLAWDCSAWIRTYAFYLEDRLECFGNLNYDIESDRGTKSASKEQRKTPVPNGENLLDTLPALQQLLYRLVCCQPEGAARHNFVVQYALSLVVKESFKLYCSINDGIINLVDMFFEMPKHDAVKALEIYKKAGRQADHLADFYDFCKTLDLAHTFQFPTLRQGFNEAPSFCGHHHHHEQHLNPNYVGVGDMKIIVSINCLKLVNTITHANNEVAKCGKVLCRMPFLSQPSYEGEIERNSKTPPPSFLATMEEYIKEAPQSGFVSQRRQEYQETREEARKPEERSLQERKRQAKEVVSKDKIVQSQHEIPASVTKEVDQPIISSQEPVDLLGLNEVNQRAGGELEKSKALALAIVERENDAPLPTNNALDGIGNTSGWELALVTAPSNISKPQVAETKMAGGFDKSLLDSLYEDDTARRRLQLHRAGYSTSYSYETTVGNMYDQRPPFSMSNNAFPSVDPQIAVMSHHHHHHHQQQQQQQMTMHQHHMLMQQQNMMMVPYSNQYAARYHHHHQHQQQQMPHMGSSNPFGDPFGYPHSAIHAPIHGNHTLL